MVALTSGLVQTQTQGNCHSLTLKGLLLPTGGQAFIESPAETVGSGAGVDVDEGLPRPRLREALAPICAIRVAHTVTLRRTHPTSGLSLEGAAVFRQLSNKRAGALLLSNLRARDGRPIYCSSLFPERSIKNQHLWWRKYADRRTEKALCR